MRRTLPRHRSHGFTLVEIIIVLVLTSALAGIVAMFIRVPVMNYVHAKSRAELSDTADIALRRMRRDVRLALPNSVRISSDGESLEFILTKTGGRYLSADDGQDSRDILSFTNAADTTFEMIGDAPTDPMQVITPNTDRIVIYNLGTGFAPADAYSGGNVATVSAINGRVITLASNPFGAQDVPLESPTRRFQVISGPVTYYCDSFANGGGGTLSRYSGYALATTQSSPPAGATVALLARNLQSCSFEYNVTINEPRALVGVTLVLRDARETDVLVSLSHQIHVNNTP